jgi:hypothetical protein
MGIGICLSCLRAPPEEPAVSWKSMTYLLISRELVVVDSSVSIDAGAAEHPADDQLADPQPVAIERLEVKHHSLSHSLILLLLSFSSFVASLRFFSLTLGRED